MKKYLKIIIAGLSGGFIGEGIMGALFTSPPVHSILYDPSFQSELFIQITPERDLFVSIAGMIILSIAHAWFYVLFFSSIPGNSWLKKGLFWGFTIWLLYWVFQEWFIYHTLLNEPFLLNLLELSILLIGSFAEGIIIAWFFKKDMGSSWCEASGSVCSRTGICRPISGWNPCGYLPLLLYLKILICYFLTF